jgi:hypothetical protein
MSAPARIHLHVHTCLQLWLSALASCLLFSFPLLYIPVCHACLLRYYCNCLLFYFTVPAFTEFSVKSPLSSCSKAVSADLVLTFVHFTHPPPPQSPYRNSYWHTGVARNIRLPWQTDELEQPWQTGMLTALADRRVKQARKTPMLSSLGGEVSLRALAERHVVQPWQTGMLYSPGRQACWTALADKNEASLGRQACCTALADRYVGQP